MRKQSLLAPLSAQEGLFRPAYLQHSCMGRISVISFASFLGRARGS